jgi:hypothetical protein
MSGSVDSLRQRGQAIMPESHRPPAIGTNTFCPKQKMRRIQETPQVFAQIPLYGPAHQSVGYCP